MSKEGSVPTPPKPKPQPQPDVKKPPKPRH